MFWEDSNTFSIKWCQLWSIVKFSIKVKHNIQEQIAEKNGDKLQSEKWRGKRNVVEDKSSEDEDNFLSKSKDKECMGAPFTVKLVLYTKIILAVDSQTNWSLDSRTPKQKKSMC